MPSFCLSGKRFGLLTGLTAFIIILIIPAPDGMESIAKKTAAVGVLMAVFWITEAIPVFVTALLPLPLFPLLGILNAKQTAVPYGDKTVFLFLGAFCLAIAIQKSGLHKRIALFIIRLIGLSPRKILFGFMAASAFISMWISNTATALMMLPIAIAVLKRFSGDSGIISQDNSDEKKFAVALMLGIAYATNIGGVGTIVGTPPNLIFAGVFKKTFPLAPEISFLKWMLLGIPLVLVFLPVIWLFLVKVGSPFRGDLFKERRPEIKEMMLVKSKMKFDEKAVLAAFLSTAFLWIFRSDMNLGIIHIPGWSGLFPEPEMLHDSTVAVFMAVILFIIPSESRKGSGLLCWEDTKELPWGILLLFGGGFALASGVESSGLSTWIAGNLKSLSGFPVIIIIVLVCLLITFLTEITSNTAVTATFLPVLGATAVAITINPLLLMLPATISASCAFMLPSATPPNAVVFSSGYISIPVMARAGVILNFTGVIIVTFLIYFIAFNLFGLSSEGLPAWAGR